MRFSNAKEMYEYLNSGHDLYHPESGIYVFSYNDRGALCKYCLSKDQVKKISERSKQNHDKYWGAFLEFGGEILEDDKVSIKPSIEFCEKHYQESDWLDTINVNLEKPDCYLLCCLDDENYASAQYFTFSSMTEAKEFCYQFAEENYPDEDLQFEESSFYHKNGHKGAKISCAYGTSFDINYIFPIHTKKDKMSFCVWHHAYDGVRFEIRKSGTHEECSSFTKDDFQETYLKLSEVSPDEVKQYEEDDQWILDDGLEWEVWDIITIHRQNHSNTFAAPLSIYQLSEVKTMDQMSGFCMEQWLDDNVDFAWGLFHNDKLIGYCSIGIADDTEPLIEGHEAYKEDSSLYLSDVFIFPEYRNQGYGSQMIKESIETRWKMDGEKNTVYLHAMGITGDLPYDEKLKSFYEQIGFSELCSDREIMVLTAD